MAACALVCGGVLCCGLCGWATPAWAQNQVRVVPKQPRAPDETQAVIPRPQQRTPFWVGQAHLLSAFTLRTEGLCPSQAACVYDGGGGLLGSVELRWPWGLAVGGLYQAWLLHGNGVYELPVHQGIGPLLRYVVPTTTLVHPFVVVAPQLLLFGDTLEVATVGAGTDMGVGVEVELNASISLVAQLTARWFTTRRFLTANDRVLRANGRESSVALALQVGLAIAQIP